MPRPDHRRKHRRRSWNPTGPSAWRWTHGISASCHAPRGGWRWTWRDRSDGAVRSRRIGEPALRKVTGCVRSFQGDSIAGSGFCPLEDGWAPLSSHRHHPLNEGIRPARNRSAKPCQFGPTAAVNDRAGRKPLGRAP